MISLISYKRTLDLCLLALGEMISHMSRPRSSDWRSSLVLLGNLFQGSSKAGCRRGKVQGSHHGPRGSCKGHREDRKGQRRPRRLEETAKTGSAVPETIEKMEDRKRARRVALEEAFWAKKAEEAKKKKKKASKVKPTKCVAPVKFNLLFAGTFAGQEEVEFSPNFNLRAKTRALTCARSGFPTVAGCFRLLLGCVASTSALNLKKSDGSKPCSRKLSFF